MSTITIEPRTAENLTFTVTTTDALGRISRQWIDLHELLVAAEAAAEALANATEAGPAFTCSEADALAALLRAAGHTDAAETWLSDHAEGDDWGDAHYEGDDED
jgi:hypothetical protein